MFKFNFSNKQIVSRNTTSYPITIEDVKSVSQYFADNPTDTSLDDYMNNYLIPFVVNNWENSTDYLLLDHTVKGYIPNIQYLNNENLELSLMNLNIRELQDFKYYPSDWDSLASKSTFVTDDYISSSEIDNVSVKIRFNSNLIPLDIFPIENNLEIQYLAGFENNDFTNLSEDIKKVLVAQVVMGVDTNKGYCEDFYSHIIEEVYSKYKIDKELISII